MSRKQLLAGVVLALLCLPCGLLLPCAFDHLDGEGWADSAYNIQIIGAAIRLYHDKHGHLPPAVVTDKDGKPLYSWRVVLLPFLGEDILYKEFRLDEPWDSPHNRPLLEKMPRLYWLGGGYNDDWSLTRYQVFVGPGTAFERPGLAWGDFPRGPGETILVVESGTPVPWSKPADLVYDPHGPLPPLGGVFGKPVHFQCYEVGRHPGFNAVFADGSDRFLRSDTDEQALRTLIVRSPQP